MFDSSTKLGLTIKCGYIRLPEDPDARLQISASKMHQVLCSKVLYSAQGAYNFEDKKHRMINRNRRSAWVEGQRRILIFELRLMRIYALSLKFTLKLKRKLVRIKWRKIFQSDFYNLLVSNRVIKICNRK